MATSEQLILPDTNWYIFQFQVNQDKFKELFDRDQPKALTADKIHKHFVDNHICVAINQKVIEEIKDICEKKKLYFDEVSIKEIAVNFPGLNYTQNDINTISAWNIKITNPDEKFDEDDMLIYVLCQRAGVNVIVTDNIRDFKRCKEVYQTNFPDAISINIWNFDDAINNLGVND